MTISIQPLFILNLFQNPPSLSFRTCFGIRIHPPCHSELVSESIPFVIPNLFRNQNPSPLSFRTCFGIRIHPLVIPMSSFFCHPELVSGSFQNQRDTKRHGLFRILLLFGFLWAGLAVQAQEFPPNSVLVVGQKNCPACKEALPRLAYYAPKWEAKNLVVRYYSLDSLPQDYSAHPVAVTRLPQRWESPLIKKLETYATPTYYWTNAQGNVIAETATAAAMQLEMIKRASHTTSN